MKLSKILSGTIFISLAVLSVTSIHPDEIPLPTYPVEPVYSDIKSGNSSSETRNETEVNTDIKTDVMIILGTNDELRGSISLPSSISFKHYKNGLLYEKTITPDELQSLSITEYSRTDAASTGSKKFFKFEPSDIHIKLKDGKSYHIDRIFGFLKSFYIETVNGRTKLYTIFGDSFDPSKGWSNVESKDLDYHKKNPHPASVRKIIFLKVN